MDNQQTMKTPYKPKPCKHEGKRMAEKCPKCGAKPKCGWLYNVLEVRGGVRQWLKLPLKVAHKLQNKTNKEFQGNLNAAMTKAIELLVKKYTGTTEHYVVTKPLVRDATLGYECSKCGYLWKAGKGKNILQRSEGV